MKLKSVAIAALILALGINTATAQTTQRQRVNRA